MIQSRKSTLKHLIKKDISFVSLILIGFFLYSLFFAVWIPSNHGLKDSLFFITPLWFFTGIIVVMCYKEDKHSTATFLKALPVSKAMIVQEKFILSQIILLYGIIQALIMYLFFPAIPFPLTLSQILLEIAYAEFYFGSYLYTFFRFNFLFARIPQNLIIGAWFFLYMNKISFNSLTIPLFYSILIFIASLGSVYLFMKLSIKHLE